MLIVQWLLVVVAVVAATSALLRARRLSKRVERLSESYWELRYDYGQLRARLEGAGPPKSPEAGDDPAGDGGRHQGQTVAFVPLSSLKR